MTVHPVLDCEDFGVDDLDFLPGVFRDGPTLLVGVVGELLQAEIGVSDLEEGTVDFFGIEGAWQTGGEAGAISVPRLELLIRNFSMVVVGQA